MNSSMCHSMHLRCRFPASFVLSQCEWWPLVLYLGYLCRRVHLFLERIVCIGRWGVIGVPWRETREVRIFGGRHHCYHCRFLSFCYVIDVLHVDLSLLLHRMLSALMCNSAMGAQVFETKTSKAHSSARSSLNHSLTLPCVHVCAHKWSMLQLFI